jgi:hypothetical protein
MLRIVTGLHMQATLATWRVLSKAISHLSITYFDEP